MGRNKKITMNKKFPCEQALNMTATANTPFKNQTQLICNGNFNNALVASCLLLMVGCGSGDSNPSTETVTTTDVTSVDIQSQTEQSVAENNSDDTPANNTITAPQQSAPTLNPVTTTTPTNTPTNTPANTPAAAPVNTPVDDDVPVPVAPSTPVNTNTLASATDTPVRSLVAAGSDLATYVPAERPVPSLRAPPAQPVVVAPVITETSPLPAPIVSVPPGVDTNINFPPFFANPGIFTVDAGQTLTLPVIPRDQNGNVPGLFTGPLPEGARFDDNFDGTKSIVWRPLQPDVGLHEISITAVDASEPLLRTTLLARIFVRLPADESSIVNLPPAIDRVVPHRARAGDEVTIQVKGTDPNGHIPRLELISSLDNFSFDVLEEDERIRVLRWQTRETDVGTHQLRFRVTDAIDPSMMAESTIEIELSTPNAFVRPGPRLRSLARGRDFYIGYASLLNFDQRPDSSIYTDIAVSEFNMVSTENSLKWGIVNPQPNVWRWDPFDKEMLLAHEHGMLMHGHPIIWHRQLPQWLNDLRLDQVEQVMLDYTDHVADRYGDHVALWDVVNESLEADGTFRNSIWYQSMGESYIDKAFRQAAISAPFSRLLYNDFDVAWEGPKSDAMFRLVSRMLDEGVPLHGVGFQMHIFTDFDLLDSVERTFQRFADLGLEIYITELDISQAGTPDLAKQAQLYRDVMSLCLQQSACKALQTWGFTDRYSWRSNYDPLMFDDDYNAKNAYFSLQQQLTQPD